MLSLCDCLCRDFSDLHRKQLLYVSIKMSSCVSLWKKIFVRFSQSSESVLVLRRLSRFRGRATPAQGDSIISVIEGGKPYIRAAIRSASCPPRRLPAWIKAKKEFISRWDNAHIFREIFSHHLTCLSCNIVLKCL